jgi:hypothetical protein
MIEGFVNDELQNMWKEALLAYFKVIFQNYVGGTEQKHESPVNISGSRPDIRSRNLSNTKQGC